MNDDHPPKVREPQAVAAARDLYADWAPSYEQDVLAAGYVAPRRVAEALRRNLSDTAVPLLDFGCGTGLSGRALAEAGFTTVDGTDISQQMLARARKAGVYRRLWRCGWGTPLCQQTGEAYGAIVAVGVIGARAAPPETLGYILDELGGGGLLAFSFNDATLADPAYQGALARLLDTGRAARVFHEHGPHLTQMNQGSEVFVLRKAG